MGRDGSDRVVWTAPAVIRSALGGVLLVLALLAVGSSSDTSFATAERAVRAEGATGGAGSSSGQSEENAPAADATPTDVEPAPTPAPPPPPLDLSSGQIIVFAAVPPKPSDNPELPLPDGADDYMALFQPDAPWGEAAEHLDGFKLDSWMIRHYFTDSELVRIYQGLNDRGITLMIEAEPLELERCDHNGSYEGPREIENLQRLKSLGIEVGVIAISQPFSLGHQLDGPDACQYELDQVLEDVIEWIAEARAIYPDVQVGSIEAIRAEPKTTVADFELWLDSYEEASGEKFAFINLDPNFNWPGWGEVALGIELSADERGVPFGILFNGNVSTTSESYIEAVAEEITYYETVLGGTPDHLVIQSSHELPDRLLPDNDIAAFTHLINRYFGSRAVFEETTIEDVDGEVELRGRLLSVDGEPLPGRIVDIQASPLGDVAQSRTLSGNVPEGAGEAVVAFRMNAEDTAVGDSAATIHSVRYEENGDGIDLVPNADFESGSILWGAYAVDRAPGSSSLTTTPLGLALELRATEDQEVWVDGTPFAVTPGAPFEFEATFGIAEGAAGTLTMAVVFLDHGRATIIAEPQPIGDGWQLQSDAEGFFSVALSVLEPGRYQFRIRTDGDVDTWPAWTTEVFDVTG